MLYVVAMLAAFCLALVIADGVCQLFRWLIR